MVPVNEITACLWGLLRVTGKLLLDAVAAVDFARRG